ncbi:hypothetical protein X971_4414 [Agrobacterium tumefaciens LBA4213 (Ach5)]|nr:hypothetical protein X971_4414 [Agrobacterium tumefaciens LBA4213 (Ach5)]
MPARPSEIVRGQGRGAGARDETLCRRMGVSKESAWRFRRDVDWLLPVDTEIATWSKRYGRPHRCR